ncbi:hypothetical protein [Metabacillus halosaccharovorans]|uniref:hypothetical protein n=1 Tax=Metabacillus halosaccharovorans TaxID=930124 RepID=UPI003735FBB4
MATATIQVVKVHCGGTHRPTTKEAQGLTYCRKGNRFIGLSKLSKEQSQTKD